MSVERLIQPFGNAQLVWSKPKASNTKLYLLLAGMQQAYKDDSPTKRTTPVQQIPGLAFPTKQFGQQDGEIGPL